MKHRLLTLLLGALLALPFSASAYWTSQNDEGKTLYFNHETVNGVTTAFITWVGWEAWENKPYYTGHISIPTVAYWGMTPLDVTAIGNNAFMGCSDMTSISIPSTITSIGTGSFNGCSGLSEILIPGSVTKIGNSAFDGCHGLTYISVPEGVTSVGFSAFGDCNNLLQVDIPSTVTWIGNSIAAGSSSLQMIYVDPANPKYSSDGGVLFDKEQTTLLFYPGGLDETFNLPPTVTAIGQQAFQKHTNIVYCKPPKQITSYGNMAFADCTGLISFLIPATLTSIGNMAFARCSNIKWFKVANPDPSAIQLGLNPFQSMSFSSCILYVPRGAKAAYASAPEWSSFVNIQEYYLDGDVTGDNIVDIEDAQYVINVMLGSLVPEGEMHSGDANNDGTIDIADAQHVINIMLTQ